MSALDLLWGALPKLIYESGYNADADLDRNGAMDSNDLAQIQSRDYKAALPPGMMSDQTSSGGGGADNIIGYGGYLFNGESYIYTVRHRHYDPASSGGGGRWLARDPAGYIDGMSLYGYGSPIDDVDPMGLSPTLSMTTGKPMHWHHKVPRQFKEVKRLMGRRWFHSRENGWMLPPEVHRELHDEARYNDWWDKKLKELKKRKLSKDEQRKAIRNLQRRAMRDFGKYYRQGHAATAAWRSRSAAAMLARGAGARGLLLAAGIGLGPLGLMVDVAVAVDGVIKGVDAILGPIAEESMRQWREDKARMEQTYHDLATGRDSEDIDRLLDWHSGGKTRTPIDLSW